MDDQVTPQQFIVFLFALACGGALSCGYWYWAFGTGPVAWALAVVRVVKRLLPNIAEPDDREPVRQRFEPSEPAAVRSQQNQIEPEEPAQNEPVHEPTQLYRLSRQEEIITLAIQRDASGAYRHSANDITKFMGGTAADVKEQIRAIRDPKPAHEPPAPARVDRPANGWNKA